MGHVGLRESLEASELVVVGSGLFGLTIAERAAADIGARVLVIERRPVVGGNARSYLDESTGIEVHRYGSHIFHTSNAEVWEYVNRFTSFNVYTHHVYTKHKGRVFPLPINLLTLSQFFGRSFTPQEAADFFETTKEGHTLEGDHLESKAVSMIGRELYDAFIMGYTAKQWQTDPKELPANIVTRLPVRLTYEGRYFDDTWQGLPLDGYSSWLEAMVEHPLIDVRTSVDFSSVRGAIPDNVPVVYTGALDEYFDYRFGVLGWRTLDLETEVIRLRDFQGTAVMNYADLDDAFTRIHEFRHLHPEREGPPDATVIMREYSRFATRQDEPYYPMNRTGDREALRAYRAAAQREKNVVFGGRLGGYLYLDMHMAVASALQTYRNDLRDLILRRRGAG